MKHDGIFSDFGRVLKRDLKREIALKAPTRSDGILLAIITLVCDRVTLPTSPSYFTLRSPFSPLFLPFFLFLTHFTPPSSSSSPPPPHHLNLLNTLAWDRLPKVSSFKFLHLGQGPRGNSSSNSGEMSKDISEWSLERQDSKMVGGGGWEDVGNPDTTSSLEEEVDGLSRQVTKRTAVQFGGVLSGVRLENVVALALALKAARDGGDSPTLTCELQFPPFNGFYNLVFKVKWSDGEVWALKIPRRGHKDDWSTIAARGSQSEYFAMDMLAKETTIPLPRVFGLDIGHDNTLNCPYMLMDWLAGVPLLDHWDRFVSKDKGLNIFDDDIVRVNLLKKLASIIVQFEAFRYRKGGTPLFNADGTFNKIGPLITRDLGLETMENLPELIELGPFTDHYDFMACKVERADARAQEDAEYAHYKDRDDHLRQMLCYFISWAGATMTDQRDFVLAHTDFGPQNILVDPDTGDLTGIIDFDGITAVPRYLSNGYRGSYPHWLTRDQDLWDGPDGDTSDYPVKGENFDYWRAIWRFVVSEAHTEFAIQQQPQRDRPVRTRHSWTDVPHTYAEGLTPAYSLDARILSIAANEPINMLSKIVNNILNKIIWLSEHRPFLFNSNNDYSMTLSADTILSTSTVQDPMTMGQILQPTSAATMTAAALMSELRLEEINNLRASEGPISPSGRSSSNDSIFDKAPLPDGFRRFQSKNVLRDAVEKRLCQDDWIILRGWFAFLFAGEDHTGRIVEGYCDDTDEGFNRERRHEPHPMR